MTSTPGSATDLVDILSKGSDPTAVLVHIGKIVDSLETFQMVGDSKVCLLLLSLGAHECGAWAHAL